LSINPGLLRSRVYLQTLTRTEDEGGGGVGAWGGEVAAWARLEHVAGNERLRGMQVVPGTTELITIRYRAGVTTAMRVRYGSRLFDIKDVSDPDERRTVLLLQCEEVA
jgi:SPP1 family predicted phage head-tail adaptor